MEKLGKNGEKKKPWSSGLLNLIRQAAVDLIIRSRAF